MVKALPTACGGTEGRVGRASLGHGGGASLPRYAR